MGKEEQTMNERQHPASTTPSGAGSAAPVAEQVESTVADPYSGRRDSAYKVQQGIYVVFGFIEVLLAIRFVLRLFGANAQAGFAQLIYGVTGPLVAPFQGLFGTVQAEGSVVESHSLVALVVYALVAWLIVKVAWLAFGETRSATATTTRGTSTGR
ncbi:MAG: YggT family protein [Chloroflexota bacterium]|nr:YggT family protein [Chloroflexota bacterium]